MPQKLEGDLSHPKPRCISLPNLGSYEFIVILLGQRIPSVLSALRDKEPCVRSSRSHFMSDSNSKLDLAYSTLLKYQPWEIAQRFAVRCFNWDLHYCLKNLCSVTGISMNLLSFSHIFVLCFLLVSINRYD
jgi:hypothetical protein